MVRTMNIDDYDEVSRLWHKIKDFHPQHRRLQRRRGALSAKNPETSVVAVEDSKIVGAILCGHDGRRGCMYHVCVDPEYRMRGIGKSMVVFAMNALKKENISKVSLIAFTKNDVGNTFWRCIGWTKRRI